LRLAIVYSKQGKKKEAADILFNIVSAARNAKDKDGNPIPESGASRAAAQELLKIDPPRHAQLPPPHSPLGLSFSDFRIDNLAHSLVGLTSAKAGLARL